MTFADLSITIDLLITSGVLLDISWWVVCTPARNKHFLVPGVTRLPPATEWLPHTAVIVQFGSVSCSMLLTRNPQSSRDKQQVTSTDDA